MWSRFNAAAPRPQPIRFVSADEAREALPETKLGHQKYRVAPRSQLKVVNPKNGARLKEPAALAFTEMVKAAASYRGDDAPNGIHLFARYGFRSFETQQQLWEKAKGKTPEAKAKSVAPPDYSEHHTGYAVDINWTSGAITEGSAAHTWLMNHAQAYGFVNSFSKGNAQGVKNEPWHWRYEGDCESREVFKPARERFGPPQTEAERAAWTACNAAQT
jgi:D-alanyl-D-alanine carboxypeptidase